MAILSSVSQLLMMPQAAVSVIEIVANKALALSTDNVDLSVLEQQALTIQLTELSFPLSFTIHQGKILCNTLTEGSICTIDTSIATLRELKADQQLTQLIKEGKLDVSGDLKVAQQFASIAQNLTIDWQSELARHIGDVPTHQLTQFGNKVTKKISALLSTAENDISEYLVHEKNMLVCQSQVAVFNQAVSDVALKTDLAAQRIEQLMKQI